MTAVADILKSKSDNTVHAIAPGDSVLDALQRMAEKRIGALLVMEGETIVGIVTEREAKVAVTIARTTDGVRKVVNVLEVVGEDETRRLDNQVLGARKAPPPSAPVENR